MNRPGTVPRRWTEYVTKNSIRISVTEQSTFQVGPRQSWIPLFRWLFSLAPPRYVAYVCGIDPRGLITVRRVGNAFCGMTAMIGSLVGI